MERRSFYEAENFYESKWRRGFISSFFFKIEETLIIVDDFNLEFGQIRLRASGGSGGHNGLKSIEEALGTNVTCE